MNTLTRTESSTPRFAAMALAIAGIFSPAAFAEDVTEDTRYVKVIGKTGADDAVASGGGAIAVGSAAKAQFADSIAIGSGAAATWMNAVAIGTNAAAGQDAVAMGYGAKAMNTHAVALGTNARASARSIALGANTVTGESAVAIGEGAVAGQSNSIAIGAGSLVMGTGSVALGTNSATMRSNVVAVGSEGSERQIVNVAAGTADTDAVNVSQLKGAGLIGDDGRTQDAVVYDAGSNRGMVSFGGTAGTRLTNVMAGLVAPASMDAVNGGQLWAVQDQVDRLGDRVSSIEGNGFAPGPAPTPGTGTPVAEGAVTDPHFASSGDVSRPATATGDNAVAVGAGSVADRNDTVSVGSTGNERQITNVAAGTQETDAANWGQVQDALRSANSYTDDRFQTLDRRIDRVGRRADAGVASALAAASMPQAYAPGQNSVGVGVGSYGGQSAIAIGASTISESGRWVFRVNGTSSRNGDKGIGAGAAMVW